MLRLQMTSVDFEKYSDFNIVLSTSKCGRNYLSFHSVVATDCQVLTQSDEMNSWVGMLYFLFKYKNLQYFLG